MIENTDIKLENFVGDWIAYTVRPFEPEHTDEPLREVLGLDVNDEIEIKKTGTDPVAGSSTSPTSEVLQVVSKRPEDRGNTLWTVDYNSANSELMGPANVPVNGNAVPVKNEEQSRIATPTSTKDSHSHTHVLKIQHMGNLTQALIDKAVNNLSASGASKQEIEKLKELVYPALKRNARSVLLTWVDRFKHAGGYAHALH